jgi:hypothetical protein
MTNPAPAKPDGEPALADEIAKALMNTFINKWFLGSYKGPVYLDCVNGEMAWKEETNAILAILRAVNSYPRYEQMREALEEMAKPFVPNPTSGMLGAYDQLIKEFHRRREIARKALADGMGE